MVGTRAVVDYPPLHDSARAIADQSDEERINYIRADRWIGYPRAVEAVNKLEELVAWPKKQRMPNLALIGPTNIGKSMIVEQFSRRHRGVSGPDHEIVDLLTIQMPAIPTVSRFSAEVLDTLNAPFRRTSSRADLERTAIAGLEQADVSILIIDEFHNTLAAPTAARAEMLGLFRYLGNKLKIPLVAVGTKEVSLVLRADPQLENRFEPFILPAWTMSRDYLALIASFVSMLPLRSPSEIVNDEMGRYLLARSEGTTGELCQLLVSAAIVAIATGEERLSSRTLAASTYQGPSVRRQQFER
jgi:hypothetical protein